MLLHIYEYYQQQRARPVLWQSQANLLRADSYKERKLVYSGLREIMKTIVSFEVAFLH